MTMKHYIIGIIVGVAAVLLISMAGCGSVTMESVDTGADVVPEGPKKSDAGHDVLAMMEHPTADGGAGTTGAAGTVGSGGAGGAAGTGAAGSSGRPLTAGCTDDGQCTSSFCAKAAGGTSGTCCSGRPDVCNTCIGGFLTPITDGNSCDNGGTCSGDVYQAHKCVGGVCMVYSVQCSGGCTPSECKQ